MKSCFSTNTTPRGFRASTLYGAIATAAAVSKLLDLPASKISAALANAASFSGGILQSFKEANDEWRYQVEVTANTGWMAAELARERSISTREPFEGAFGLLPVFAQSKDRVSDLSQQLGTNWQTLRVTFKPFPVCAFNQIPVTAALELRLQVAAQNIYRVRVFMNPYECGYAGMDSKRPLTSISGALMSIPFCIAIALIHGAPSLSQMTQYSDPEVKALIKQTDLISDPAIKTRSFRIKVQTKSGQVHEVFCPTIPSNYAYGWAKLMQRLHKISKQENIPKSALRNWMQLSKFRSDPDPISQDITIKAPRSPYTPSVRLKTHQKRALVLGSVGLRRKSKGALMHCGVHQSLLTCIQR